MEQFVKGTARNPSWKPLEPALGPGEAGISVRNEGPLRLSGRDRTESARNLPRGGAPGREVGTPPSDRPVALDQQSQTTRAVAWACGESKGTLPATFSTAAPRPGADGLRRTIESVSPLASLSRSTSCSLEA